MRTLARRLADIRFPSVRDSFAVWGTKPTHYSELCNDDVFFVIEADGREIAAYADLNGISSTDHEAAEANHLWKRLFSHLHTGGFAGTTDKVADFELKMWHYFETCYSLAELVRKRIESETGTPFAQHQGQGLASHFVTSLCVYALQEEVRLPAHTAYKVESIIDDSVLTYGGEVIFAGDPIEALHYCGLHKDLKFKWIDSERKEMIAAVSETREDLEHTIREVRNCLFAFSGKDLLPGHCDVCPTAVTKKT
jgi:hypothetical protein